MKKRIILITIGIVFVSMLIWRLWPRSISKIMPADEGSVSSFSANAMVGGFENGQSYNNTYCIDISEKQGESVEKILEILDSSGYRQDYRNLLPWGVDYVDADKNYDRHTVIFKFFWGNEIDENFVIQFLSNSLMVVSKGGVSGFRIYHPTNHKTLYDLVEYVQKHGTMQ